MKLRLKHLFYPGFNLNLRARSSIKRFFLVEPDIDTLDVGAGNGYFSWLAAKRGSKVLGISYDSGEIERCRQFFQSFGNESSRLRFEVQNVGALRSRNERYDQILLLEVIEHVDHDKELLNDLILLLKPGGILHLSTPDVTMGVWSGVLDRFATGGHCRLGYHADRLRDMVTDAGFDIVYQNRMGNMGNFLVAIQHPLSRLLGASHAAQGVVFVLLYPAYLVLKYIPIPYHWKLSHYIIARKRMTPSVS